METIYKIQVNIKKTIRKLFKKKFDLIFIFTFKIKKNL